MEMMIMILKLPVGTHSIYQLTTTTTITLKGQPARIRNREVHRSISLGIWRWIGDGSVVLGLSTDEMG
jgi:anti-sigma factor ChrR (cupin superfamily)